MILFIFVDIVDIVQPDIIHLWLKQQQQQHWSKLRVH